MERNLEPDRFAFNRDKWIESCGGLRGLSEFTMDKFIPRFDTPGGFPEKKSLYIHGPTGTGKTHLATAIALEYSKNPQDMIVVKPSFIFRDLRHSKDALEELTTLRYYTTRKILVIDDLGVSKDTDFSFQTLYEIIDGRYMNYSGGLVVTSNLSLNDLGAKLGDDRIPSRLMQMCKMIKLSGKDHRLGPQTENKNVDK